ncbi:MAG: T9SS type A sorting domain-containing protein [Bacteroidetes bacterium]|nr:T9SS type A sorting domain-containing protein [Bacteroidota bacterium]
MFNPSSAVSIDSINVLSYKINIDFTKFKSKTLSSSTVIKCKPLKNYSVKKIKFMLLKLNVDSVFFKDSISNKYTKVDFEYNDTLIILNKSLDYTSEICIYYHGNPQKDEMWGGFYFSGEYAFNLGVAFSSSPHNFGRVWFPCIDNFTDKAIFSYSVKVPRGYTAVCGGLFIDTLQTPDNCTIWNWSHSIPINTYLASIAVAPYKFVEYAINGRNTVIPVKLAAIASDTSKLKSSFKNLKNAVEIFEDYYGKYLFERVGYCLVPFNSGAMEHACNIAYPIYAVDGTLAFETLMAHELSHHWWGNNVTCSNASDMWINEGWASFSEALFTEKIYGEEAYKKYINKIHKEVLQFSHLKDATVTAVSNVSHQNTYGSHVYKKGADMVHTIRQSMGDNNFKQACVSIMEKYKFNNINTSDFIGEFSKYGTSQFFLKQMISDTGFCHFTIFKQNSEFKNNLWETDVTYKNRTRMGNHIYDSIPYELYVFDKNFKKEIFNVFLGKNENIKFQSKFKPEFICFDFDGKVSDAITDEYILTDKTGNYNLDYAMMNINITANDDTSLLRVEHHWNYPDEYFLDIPGITISKERFWKVDGILDKSFKASAIVNYDGSKLTSYTSGWLDNKLLQNNAEDSIILLYRPDAISNWQIENNITKSTGGKTDKKGTITINELKKGEYTFALKGKQQSSGINEFNKKKIKIYPNPAEEYIYAIWNESSSNTYYEITDFSGKIILNKDTENKNSVKIDTCGFINGSYFFTLFRNGLPIVAESFIISR